VGITSRAGATAACLLFGQSLLGACFSEQTDTDDDDAADTTAMTSPSTTDAATVTESMTGPSTEPTTTVTTSSSATQTASDTDPPPVDTSTTDPSDTDPSDTDPVECMVGDGVQCGDSAVYRGEVCFFEPEAVGGGLDKIGDSAVVDLDQDGDADLVFSDGGGGFVAFADDGTLQDATPVTMGETWTVTAGRLSNDGPIGIVFGGADANVTIMTFDVVFDEHAVLPAPGPFVTARMVDLDDDGIPDLIVGSEESTTLYVYMNDGLGTFSSQTEAVIGAIDGVADMRPYYAAGAPALALLTRDGRLLVSPASAGALGDFVAVDLEQTFAVPTVATLAVADFEGNGHADLVVGDLGRAFVYRGTRDGSWVLPPQVLGESSVGDVAAAVGDVDNDQVLDVLLADPAGELVRIYLSSPDGEDFAEADTIPTPTSPRGVGVIDIDGNCANDVFVLGGAWLALHRANP
jgi:hypothetical protein